MYAYGSSVRAVSARECCVSECCVSVVGVLCGDGSDVRLWECCMVVFCACMGALSRCRSDIRLGVLCW